MSANVMIDIETMGGGCQAAISSIGAVVFVLSRTVSSYVSPPDFQFYNNIDLQSCLDYGLQVDGRTVMWWMGREDEARRALDIDVKPLPVVLGNLTSFIDECREIFDTKKMYVWGNGSTFDNVIVNNAYRVCGMERPWHYREDRDMRTYISICSSLGMRWEWPERQGVHHNALSDAINQARAMCMLHDMMMIHIKESSGKL